MILMVSIDGPLASYACVSVGLEFTDLTDLGRLMF